MKELDLVGYVKTEQIDSFVKLMGDKDVKQAVEALKKLPQSQVPIRLNSENEVNLGFIESLLSNDKDEDLALILEEGKLTNNFSISDLKMSMNDAKVAEARQNEILASVSDLKDIDQKRELVNRLIEENKF